jgi:hypothetical protein
VVVGVHTKEREGRNKHCKREVRKITRGVVFCGAFDDYSIFNFGERGGRRRGELDEKIIGNSKGRNIE